MPSLGADMRAGRLLEWLKQPGDRVTRGDIIAEVDTDKGVIEVEVFTSGVVERLLVEPGTRVPVGTPLATIREEGVPEAAPAAAGPPGVPAPPERHRASPLARRRAAELGLDLRTIAGSGPSGVVTREDVERASRAPAAPPEEAGEVDRTARMRAAIAAAVSRSKREIPHYYLATTVDLGGLMTWLADYNRNRPVAERLGPNALLLKATALALRDFPDLNAQWLEGRAVPAQGIHLGLAISLRGGGLVVATLPNTDQRPVSQLMTDVMEVVRRARTGGLRSSELSGSTVTVTQLGDRGVESVFGVIYPPQVAIVGFGRVVERPWVVGGQVVPRPVVTVTLAADHRASDGHRGGLFLFALSGLLQEPERL
ncbi:MAG TPA: dihydrolipoamide acetyltransferase family protein [Gemmatimonadales bacterium]